MHYITWSRVCLLLASFCFLLGFAGVALPGGGSFLYLGLLFMAAAGLV